MWARFRYVALVVVFLFAHEAGASVPLVRVLLYEGSGPVRMGFTPADSGRRRAIEIRTRGDTLSVEGRPVGAVYRLASREPIEFEGARYRGEMEVRRVEAGLAVINRIGLEPYVVGTLFREVYVDWEEDALCAQTVVARTFALAQMEKERDQPYDLRADTGNQMYGGIGSHDARAREIVEKTRGEYLSYLGKPILAVYHASAGGQTAGAEEVWGTKVPYLVSVPVDNEWSAPDAYWRVAMSSKELGKALEAAGYSVGTVRSMKIVGRSPSGRVATVEIRGDRKAIQIEGRTLRQALGQTVLRSTLFELRLGANGDFIFVGSGYGHGVGLSQWGAQTMAQRGASYRKILNWFYPGAILTRLDGAGSPSTITSSEER